MAREKRAAATDAQSVEGPWDLPAGWRWRRLGEALPLSYGKALSAAVRKAGTVPVYGSNGRVGVHAHALTSGPTLLVGRKGGAGLVHFSEEPCWPIDTAFYAEPANDVEVRYGFYLLKHLRLDRMDQSTAIPSLSRDAYSDLVCPFPDREIQRALVRRLDALFCEIEEGEVALGDAQSATTTYRQALLKAAVTGELTTDWRLSNPVHESGADLLVRILADRRKRAEHRRYLEPEPPDTSELPDLPDGWCWAAAGQLCDFITKGTTPAKGRWGNDVDRTVPFIRVTNLSSSGVLDFTDAVFITPQTHEAELSRSRTEPNDVLMNIVGPPLGQVGVVPTTFPSWNINQAIARFRPLGGYSSDFLSLALRSQPARGWLSERAKTTAGQTNLTLELCRTVPVPVPPIAEQFAIVDRANEAVARMESLWADPIDLQELRQSILASALRGKLT